MSPSFCLVILFQAYFLYVTFCSGLTRLFGANWIYSLFYLGNRTFTHWVRRDVELNKYIVRRTDTPTVKILGLELVFYWKFLRFYLSLFPTFQMYLVERFLMSTFASLYNQFTAAFPSVIFFFFLPFRGRLSWVRCTLSQIPARPKSSARFQCSNQ